MPWDDEQRANAQAIYSVGIQLGASIRDIQVAIAAAIVESGLRNLDYGDRDSIGLFQQRDAWGSREARLDPFGAARMFFLGGNAGQEGLLDIANRDSRSIGDLAQDVQVSAFPERYGQQAEAAGSLLKSLDPNAEVSSGAPVTGTLGAVPGLQTQPPPGPMDIADAEPSVTEVNALGEVTADEAGIGSLSFGESFVDGLTFEDAPQQAAQGRVRAATTGTPSLSEFGIDTSVYENGDVVGGGPTGPGEVFSGSFEGHDALDLTELDGETVDYLTVAALEAAKQEFDGDFSIMQGSHSHDVAASGNTHAGGGVVDLSVSNGDWAGAMAALRKIGFAAWVRNVPGYGQAGSGAHIHAVLMDHPGLSDEAAVQVQSYLNNDDGLQGSRADDGPRDWVNNRFRWEDALAAEDEHEPLRKAIIKEAATYLGVPVKWGGEDYDGVDDIGLVRKVYGSIGAPVPRYAFEAAYAADPEPIDKAKLGDLVVWANGTRLGIYDGAGNVVYANGPGSAVQMGEVAGLGEVWSIPVPSLIYDAARFPGEPKAPRSAFEYRPTQYSPAPQPSYSTSVDGTPQGYGSTPTAPSGGGGKKKGGKDRPGDGPDNDGFGPQLDP